MSGEISGPAETVALGLVASAENAHGSSIEDKQTEEASSAEAADGDPPADSAEDAGRRASTSADEEPAETPEEAPKREMPDDDDPVARPALSGPAVPPGDLTRGLVAGSARAATDRTRPLLVAVITVVVLIGIYLLGPRELPEPAAGAPTARVEPEGSTPPPANARAPAAADPSRAAPSPSGSTPTRAEDPGPKEPMPAVDEPVDTDTAEQAAPKEGSAAPRALPPGTPPEVAKVFEKLPISPTDGPALGGIGRSGIHIDQISMGTEYRGSECRGQADQFSITKRQRANACFRVVHQRQDEELRVLWQKDGGTVRRSRLKVPPVHAYRTRAYLVLRQEYAGRWTVRIMSSDGVELATKAFTVVE